MEEKALDAIRKWHKQEKERKFIADRIRILKEEMDALTKEQCKLNKDRYKYTDIAVKEHKFWSNVDGTVIQKIGDLERGEFFRSKKGEKDRRYFSSSLGILFNVNCPISEERYNELYNSM